MLTPPGLAMQVHQVKTPLSNSYVIDDGEHLFVVDVAARCHGYVVGFLEDVLGRQPEEVGLVVCTHDDMDHIGGVRHLALACDAPFALPYASRSRLRKTWNDPGGWLMRMGTSMVEATRPRAWKMYANPARHTRFERRPRKRMNLRRGDVARQRPSHRLKHGDELPGFSDWRVLHTPGHTWDSCCYYHEPSGSLLSGDTLLGSAQKNRLVRPSIFSNLDQFRTSLRHLQELDVRSVYPGHGSAFHGEGLLDDLV